MLKMHWLSPLIISMNFEEKNMAINNPEYRVIIMDDSPAKYMQLIQGEYRLPKNVSVLPVLLPPFDSINAFIEGEFEKSNLIYEDYLNSPYVQHCLNTIFTLLFNNVAVMIYIPEDADPVINCINTLINYIYARYGVITCNSSQIVPALDMNNIDLNKYAVLIDLMYMNNTIPLDEFALQYPIEYAPLSPTAIIKVGVETGNLNADVDPSTIDFNYWEDVMSRLVYGLKLSIIEKHNNPNNQDKVSIAFTMEEIPK